MLRLLYSAGMRYRKEAVIDMEKAAEMLTNAVKGFHGRFKIMYGQICVRVDKKVYLSTGGNKILERRPKDYMEIMQNMYLWNPLDYHGLYGYDPLPKGKKSVVSVAQVNPVQGDVEANIAIIAEKAAAAAVGGSELIVFPELMLTGPVDAAGAAKLAECVQGASVDKVIDISMKYHIYIVAGMVRSIAATAANVLQNVCL